MMHLVALLSLAADPANAATPGIASTLEDSSKSTPKEMAEGAAEMMAEIDAAVATVKKLIETAEEDKKKNEEAIKCLYTRLPPLVTIQEIAGKRITAMRTNLSSGDVGKAGTEYRQVAVLFSAARDALAAAHACVKGTAGESGKTSSTITGGEQAVEIDSEIPVEIPDVSTAY